MSDISIYHNPRCSKSRQTLALLEQQGIQANIIEYLKAPPSADTLTTIISQLDITPRQLLRKSEAIYKELNLKETAKVLGDIESNTKPHIAAEVTGKIISMSVNEGESVQSGQLLAKQDPEPLLIARERALADIQRIKALIKNFKKYKNTSCRT